jgi:hypothetical protein
MHVLCVSFGETMKRVLIGSLMLRPADNQQTTKQKKPFLSKKKKKKQPYLCFRRYEAAGRRTQRPGDIPPGTGVRVLVHQTASLSVWGEKRPTCTEENLSYLDRTFAFDLVLCWYTHVAVNSVDRHLGKSSQ